MLLCPHYDDGHQGLSIAFEWFLSNNQEVEKNTTCWVEITVPKDLSVLKVYLSTIPQ